MTRSDEHSIRRFGARFAAARERSGLSNEAIAASSRVSQRSVAAWASGKTWPRLDHAHAAASAMGVSVDELLGVDEPLPASRRTLELIRSLQEALADATETTSRLAREVGVPETNGGSASHG